MDTIVFACVQNAGRSQIAAAFFNTIADPARARAESAGTQPTRYVHDDVVAVMAEVAIDLSNARPQLLTDDLAGRARWLITMGCGASCPAAPSATRDEWAIRDPAGLSLPTVRLIRDDIRRRVEAFVEREGYGRD